MTGRLTKEFRGFVAVKDVNPRVRRGTIHALIGPNGAGKTTCFNLLTYFFTQTRRSGSATMPGPSRWLCTERYKLLAFVLSAALRGLADGTKTIVFRLAALTDVHWSMSGEVGLMTLLGGLGTVFGLVVGALIVVTLENYLAQLGAWVTVVQGAIFVVCVLTFRRGVVSELARILNTPL